MDVRGWRMQLLACSSELLLLSASALEALVPSEHWEALLTVLQPSLLAGRRTRSWSCWWAALQSCEKRMSTCLGLGRMTSASCTPPEKGVPSCGSAQLPSSIMVRVRLGSGCGCSHRRGEGKGLAAFACSLFSLSSFFSTQWRQTANPTAR